MDVSIIITAYNAELYVKRCLDHILQGDIRKISFEIIVVDDGSTDNTLALARSYSHVPELKLITGKNGGVAVARNRGMRSASGKYLVFVDVDDLLDVTKLEKCVMAADRQEAEVLIFDYVIKHESGKTEPRSVFLNPPPEQTVYSGKEILRSFYGYDGYVWMALYDRDFMISNGLLFGESIKLWEDMDLIQKVLLKASRVVYLQETAYQYIRHSDSWSGEASFEKTVATLLVLADIRQMDVPLDDGALREYYERLHSHHLYQTIKHILRARFPREQVRALFAIVIEKKMLPLKVDGNLKERLDKRLLNRSLSCFCFWFCWKKGLWMKKKSLR